MEKTERRFVVDYKFDWKYTVTLAQMRKDLDAMEKLGVTDIEIDANSFYDSSILEIVPISCRMETDEELKLRLDKVERENEAVRQRELGQWQRLQLKYGKKG